MQLKNLNILVTGSAKRIGKQIAFTLAKHGANIIVHYNSSKDEAEQTIKEIQKLGVKAFSFQANLSQAQEVKKLVEFTIEKLGSIDVLINSASMFKKIPFQEVTEKDLNENFAVNLRAPFLLSQAAAKNMLKNNKGKIINIIDWATENPYPGYLHYHIAKGGLKTLTFGLAKELSPKIQVLGINPGPIIKPPNMSAEREKEVANQTLLKKWGSPQDISNTVKFLIEGTDFMTGTIINVDGGSSLADKY